MAMELSSTDKVVALEATPSTSSSMNPEAEEGTMKVHEKVLTIKTQLETIVSNGGTESNDEILTLLKKLGKFPMNLDILSTTRIGMIVNHLRKNSENKEVISLGRALIKKWKKFLNPEEDKDKKEGDDNGDAVNVKVKEEPKMSKKKVSRKLDDDLEQASTSSGVNVKKPKMKSPPKFVNSAKTIACFPPVVTTTDAIRLKCRQLLLQAIQGDGNLPDETNDPDYLAEQLEHHIFSEFKSTEAKYRTRVFSRVANLKDVKNPNLRLNLLLGELTPARLAKMTPEEMASDELKAVRTKFVQEAINQAQLATNQGTKTDLLKCGKCHKRDCTYNQLQTRSADEPMTTFVLCNGCGHRWKFN